MYGYPGVSLAGGSPLTQLGPGADRSPSSPKQLVTLKSGGTAHAVLQVAQAENYPTSTCGPKAATDLKIYPPNERASLYIPFSTTACSKAVHQLTISTVTSGS